MARELVEPAPGTKCSHVPPARYHRRYEHGLRRDRRGPGSRRDLGGRMLLPLPARCGARHRSTTRSASRTGSSHHRTPVRRLLGHGRRPGCLLHRSTSPTPLIRRARSMPTAGPGPSGDRWCVLRGLQADQHRHPRGLRAPRPQQVRSGPRPRRRPLHRRLLCPPSPCQSGSHRPRVPRGRPPVASRVPTARTSMKPQPRRHLRAPRARAQHRRRVASDHFEPSHHRC